MITICILAKDSIKGYTVMCLHKMYESPLIKQIPIQETWAIGQSDLPKARSIRLTKWYRSASPGDIFMFLDSDQTFYDKDILRSIQLLKDNDLVCGAYARTNKTPTVEAKDRFAFLRDKVGELYYGSTGFMMMTYTIVDKVAKHLNEEVRYSTADEDTIIPFFLERIVTEEQYEDEKLWLGEDYSYSWLVRQVGGRIMGYISDTIGHILSTITLVHVPSHKTWPEKSIVIFASKTPEAWSPQNVLKGIGGSELAIIKLAPVWVKHHYSVTVYCYCDHPGTYDGVEYKDILHFMFVDMYNILILWRNTALIKKYDLAARKYILDMHDIPEHTIKMKNIDTVCVKSAYHASYFDYIPKEKIAIIPNGGKQEPIEQKRDYNYLIYTSSYDRGLQHMLVWGWPRIKMFVPNAYLRIYYGWDGFDAVLSNLNEEEKARRLEWKEWMLELLQQEGVTECGRISHPDLLREKARANIHYYVGNFREIDCISVRESASLGAIPIVSKSIPVFEEKDYCICIDGDPETQEMQEHAADVIIDLLQNYNRANDIRLNMCVPDDETWENTAKKWLSIFNI